MDLLIAAAPRCVGALSALRGPRQLRHNKRPIRFNLREQRKVDGQCKLYCLVQDIEQLVHHGYWQWESELVMRLHRRPSTHRSRGGAGGTASEQCRQSK